MYYEGYGTLTELTQEEQEAIEAWRLKEFPKYEYLLTTHKCIVKLRYVGYTNVDINIGKYIDEGTGALKFIAELPQFNVSTTSTDTFVNSYTTEGPIGLFLNLYTLHLTDVAYNILPASVGLQAKNKTFDGGLINDARE